MNDKSVQRNILVYRSRWPGEIINKYFNLHAYISGRDEWLYKMQIVYEDEGTM